MLATEHFENRIDALAAREIFDRFRVIALLVVDAVLQAELADSGVRFLSIDPGEMDTDMHAAAMPEADRTSLADPAEVATRIADLMETAEAIPSGSRVEIAHVGSPA